MNRGRLLIALPALPTPGTVPSPEAAAWPRLPALEALLARATRNAAASERDWRAWLLCQAGLAPDLLSRLPAGPATRLADPRPLASGEAGSWWLCAPPVHLLTGLDRLQLARPGVLPLAANEGAALREGLVELLAAHGFEWWPSAAAAEDWLLRSVSPCEFEYPEPARALDEDLRTVRPRGPQARRLLALRGELETSLHAHPLNAARAAQGRAPVNALWPHGAGQVLVPAPARLALPPLQCDDAVLCGVWRALGGSVRRDAQWPDQALHAGWVLARSRPLEPEALITELQQLEARIAAPLRRSRWRGGGLPADLLIGHGAWRVRASDGLRFWRRPRALYGGDP